MYNYILIEGIASYKNTLVDRKNYRIIEINALNNEIKDITKEILKYYNKSGVIGNTIFKAFVNGDYKGYDLIKKSNNLEEIKIPFNLNNYYDVFNSLTSKEKKEYIIKYDKDIKNRFIFEKEETIPSF